MLGVDNLRARVLRESRELCTSQSKSPPSFLPHHPPPPPQPGKGGKGGKTDHRLSKLSRYAGSWTRIASTVFGVAKRLGPAQKAVKMAEKREYFLIYFILSSCLPSLSLFRPKNVTCESLINTCISFLCISF